MINLHRITLVACVLSMLFLSTTTRAAQETGFKPLFDGKTLTGWRFSGQKTAEPLPKNWSVSDGIIHLSGGGKPHLVTVGEYGNFEMQFEWRAMREKYNSGFYIRTAKDAGINQINLAKGAEGGFVRGKVTGARTVPELQRKAGEWNEWRVKVVGDKVSFWCNGKLAWEAEGLQPAKGHIGFQAEGAPIDFRNLEIRELK